MKNETTQQPIRLSYRQLSGDLYEVELNENITQTERQHNDITETIYISDRYASVVKVNTNADLIVGLIRLKYSQNDEYALINKGIENSQDIEYIAYRKFVSECKGVINNDK